MVEVKLYLHDAIEIQMLAQFEGFLEQKRAQDNARQFENAQTPEPAIPTPATEPTEPTAPPAATDTQVIASITPEGATKAAPIPTDAEMVAALTKYHEAKGLPAAVALLGEFNAKRVGDISPDLRAAFIGRTKETSK